MSQDNGPPPQPAPGTPTIRDDVRLLARDSTHGYVHYASSALHAEPEAVSAEDQDLITRQAQERNDDDRRHALRMTLERTERTRQHYEAMAKHAARQARRLQRKISDAR